MKNPLIAGIEPATFRFVAQHHCATAVPPSSGLRNPVIILLQLLDRDDGVTVFRSVAFYQSTRPNVSKRLEIVAVVV